MKLLVFAHTPPPHHGQSYMVQLMLDGFGGDRRNLNGAPDRDLGKRSQSNGELRVQCFHVNSRLSKRLEDIGDFRVGKFLLLLSYCLQALWLRVRHGVNNFYYIPAPGKRSALYRDWLVMLLCRRFFKRVILHWHAAGLGKWLETERQIRTRAWTYWLMKQVDLSIVLSRYNRADAEKLFSKQIKVISNGIPDPCPEFNQQILPRRKARFEARQVLFSGDKLTQETSANAEKDPNVVNILYLAHCTREKGLFETLAGVRLANERLERQHSPVSLRLTVAGSFVTAQEQAEFERQVAENDAIHTTQYLGFVSGERKHQLLREADIFCFPTYYQNENQPVNLLEAMAFGLPILTTRWRSIPELFPANYAGLVDTHSPEQTAEGLLRLARHESGEGFREIFLQCFTLERHLLGLAEAFHSLEHQKQAAAAHGVAEVV